MTFLTVFEHINTLKLVWFYKIGLLPEEIIYTRSEPAYDCLRKSEEGGSGRRKIANAGD